ncbi:hypothetical protein BOX15_Mlig015749g4, partial [Macrostomum lignano]
GKRTELYIRRRRDGVLVPAADDLGRLRLTNIIPLGVKETDDAVCVILADAEEATAASAAAGGIAAATFSSCRPSPASSNSTVSATPASLSSEPQLPSPPPPALLRHPQLPLPLHQSRSSIHSSSTAATNSRDRCRMFTCRLCDRTFTNSRNCQLHQQSHLPLTQRPRYRCGLCCRVYTSPSGLSKHCRRCHSTESNVCGASYSFHCGLCHAGFNSRELLARHERLHNGRRNYLHVVSSTGREGVIAGRND